MIGQRVDKASQFGIGLALVTALLFATSVNVAPLAYAAGASVLTLLAVRFVFTAVVSTALNRERWFSKSIMRRDAFLLLLVSFSLAGQSLGYMASVNYLPVSIAVILFYTFPILTYVMSAVGNGRSFHLAPFMALGIALLGIYLLVQNGSAESWSMIGVFWALFAAVMQAAVNIISQKIRSVSGWGMVKYTSFIPAIVILGLYLGKGEFSLAGIGWCLVTATVFCGGLYLFYRSVATIGSMRTANLLYFEPVFTLILSLFIFGERLQLLQWLGIGIIVIATFFLEKQEQTVLN